MRFRTACWSLCILVAAVLAAVAAEPQFPALTGPVVDQANVLSPEARQQLTDRLLAYQSQSGHQVVVATVPSLEGYEIRDYGNRLFRNWQLGDKTRNDGVLLLVAPNERQVSIEVGYGVEPDLTDALSRIIIENAMVPRFKAGDYEGGLSAAINDVSKALAGNGTEIVERARNQGAPTLADMLPLILLFIVVVVILTNTSRGGRVIILGPGGGGYRGDWPGGGGWSGGGGGYGGGYSGGGGSSGGGGASGSW